MRTIAPTTIRPDPKSRMHLIVPLVQKAWDRELPPMKPLSPTPKFATIGGALDVKI